MINSTFLNVQSYYQCLLFTNECTSDCLKNSIKVYIKIANMFRCSHTETCRSCFNVNFNIVFKTITCAFIGE